MNNQLVLVFCTALTLTGCYHQKIIIDKQGVDLAQYQSDLAQCQQYAQDVEIAAAAASGAARGGLIGGAIGAIFGEAGKGAGAGAVSGGAKGASRAESTKQRVVKKCLQGRGYRVLS